MKIPDYRFDNSHAPAETLMGAVDEMAPTVTELLHPIPQQGLSAVQTEALRSQKRRLRARLEAELAFVAGYSTALLYAELIAPEVFAAVERIRSARALDELLAGVSALRALTGKKSINIPTAALRFDDDGGDVPYNDEELEKNGPVDPKDAPSHDGHG